MPARKLAQRYQQIAGAMMIIGLRFRRPAAWQRVAYKGVPEDKRADLIPPGWFDKWQQATWATDPKAASANPSALRAPNGVTRDIRGSGKATYDPGKITAPTLMVQAQWDQDTPPYMSQALFPLLTAAPWKQYRNRLRQRRTTRERKAPRKS